MTILSTQKMLMLCGLNFMNNFHKVMLKNVSFENPLLTIFKNKIHLLCIITDWRLWEELVFSFSDSSLLFLWCALIFYGIAAKQKLMQLLMGPNDSYSTIRSQILLMDPLLIMSKAIAVFSKRNNHEFSVFNLPLFLKVLWLL